MNTSNSQIEVLLVPQNGWLAILAGVLRVACMMLCIPIIALAIIFIIVIVFPISLLWILLGKFISIFRI